MNGKSVSLARASRKQKIQLMNGCLFVRERGNLKKKTHLRMFCEWQRVTKIRLTLFRFAFMAKKALNINTKHGFSYQNQSDAMLKVVMCILFVLTSFQCNKVRVCTIVFIYNCMLNVERTKSQNVKNKSKSLNVEFNTYK